MKVDICTKDEIINLINEAKKDFREYVDKKITKTQIDALPKLLQTKEMARVLNIRDGTLRARTKEFYTQGKHFFKKNGRIYWDKNAVLESRENEILR
ncbi:hypothetical protein YY92_08360 [Campylobacter fetus]|uniref:hypothetical protein n=1 Tax=Campylobacter fetus TaxID=196 RepID=UPI0011C7F465|nr:hypothetical protein [Campylobacter fetus]EAJ1232599.1 hypothetical protein [Campylobacter fetus]EAK0414722.1 hypothetical protein [Campylobacter fetus]TXF09162.1 hypothetical protein FPD25_03245 [Campylobacter fetus subsp. fetus]